MPSLNLYEYFARNITRDINHTTIARLLKIDALTILNKYNEAITLIQRIQRGERLPHSTDEKFKTNLQTPTNKYVSKFPYFFLTPILHTYFNKSIIKMYKNKSPILIKDAMPKDLDTVLITTYE
jgi:hypothetical protein